MLKAIEQSADGKLVVTTSAGRFVVAELSGGELLAEDVAAINSVYPGAIAEGYETIKPKVIQEPHEHSDQSSEE